MRREIPLGGEGAIVAGEQQGPFLGVVENPVLRPAFVTDQRVEGVHELELWRQRAPADTALTFCLHLRLGGPARGPGLQELVRGRDALVKSYADFMTKSDVTEYVESGHAIDRWGTTAVARFDWTMAWAQNGIADRGSGQDLFVFQQRGTRWIAVERVMLC